MKAESRLGWVVSSFSFQNNSNSNFNEILGKNFFRERNKKNEHSKDSEGISLENRVRKCSDFPIFLWKILKRTFSL